jgi:membrane protein YdbS with pleckstrin-like domain
VPIERLHKLEMQKGPIDRMFKVAKLIVTTAGGDVTIRFLDDDKAEQIAEFLKRRINQIVIEQREEDGN